MGNPLLEKLREERSAHQEAIEKTIEAAAEESRDLTEAEDKNIEEADERIKALDERIQQLSDIELRNAEAANLAAKVDKASGVEVRDGSKVVVTNEERTYTKEKNLRGESSFLADVMNHHSSPHAAERIHRHERECEVDGYTLKRDVGTGAFAGLTVPQYLTDEAIPYARAGRKFLDNCVRVLPLPASGMTVNMSKITTSSAVAAQASENSDTQETNLDDTLLTVNVNTYAGKQDVSLQAIQRGTGIDSVVVQDLVMDYHTKVDYACLNSDGTSGTHEGLRNADTPNAVSYTDATPTAAELWPKLFDAIQQAQLGAYTGPTHWVMHPRRAAWLASQIGTSFPLIQQIASAPQTGGNVASWDYSDTFGMLAGLPVVLDGNVLTNLGGGTEDEIYAVDARQIYFWEDTSAPFVIRAEQPLANQLSVRFVIYGFSAFTAERYPTSASIISGTGLAAPTF